MGPALKQRQEQTAVHSGAVLFYSLKMLFLHPQLPHTKIRKRQELGLALHKAAQGALREIPGRDFGPGGSHDELYWFCFSCPVVFPLTSHPHSSEQLPHPQSLPCGPGGSVIPQYRRCRPAAVMDAEEIN